MNWLARMHFLHKAWRYRLRSEKFGVSYLLSRALRGKTVVDIGANCGIFSYWMSSCVGREGHVLAFEPQPELVAQLHALRQQFRLDQLQIAEFGLSTKDTELTLRRPKTHWAGASFESPARDSSACDFITARVTTLDGFLAKHPQPPIAFIKCDVEGHELSVFQGGENILTRDRPELLFECHQGGNPDCAVFHYLRSLDYDGFCFHGGGLAPVADYPRLKPTMHRKALADFVFVPREQVATTRTAANRQAA